MAHIHHSGYLYECCFDERTVDHESDSSACSELMSDFEDLHVHDDDGLLETNSRGDGRAPSAFCMSSAPVIPLSRGVDESLEKKHFECHSRGFAQNSTYFSVGCGWMPLLFMILWLCSCFVDEKDGVLLHFIEVDLDDDISFMQLSETGELGNGWHIVRLRDSEHPSLPEPRVYYWQRSTRTSMWGAPDGVLDDVFVPLSGLSNGWYLVRRQTGEVYYWHRSSGRVAWKLPQHDPAVEDGTPLFEAGNMQGAGNVLVVPPNAQPSSVSSVPAVSNVLSDEEVTHRMNAILHQVEETYSLNCRYGTRFSSLYDAIQHARSHGLSQTEAARLLALNRLGNEAKHSGLWPDDDPLPGGGQSSSGGFSQGFVGQTKHCHGEASRVESDSLHQLEQAQPIGRVAADTSSRQGLPPNVLGCVQFPDLPTDKDEEQLQLEIAISNSVFGNNSGQAEVAAFSRYFDDEEGRYWWAGTETWFWEGDVTWKYMYKQGEVAWYWRTRLELEPVDFPDDGQNLMQHFTWVRQNQMGRSQLGVAVNWLLKALLAVVVPSVVMWTCKAPFGGKLSGQKLLSLFILMATVSSTRPPVISYDVSQTGHVDLFGDPGMVELFRSSFKSYLHGTDPQPTLLTSYRSPFELPNGEFKLSAARSKLSPVAMWEDTRIVNNFIPLQSTGQLADFTVSRNGLMHDAKHVPAWMVSELTSNAAHMEHIAVDPMEAAVLHHVTARSDCFAEHPVVGYTLGRTFNVTIDMQYEKEPADDADCQWTRTEFLASCRAMTDPYARLHCQALSPLIPNSETSIERVLSALKPYVNVRARGGQKEAVQARCNVKGYFDASDDQHSELAVRTSGERYYDNMLWTPVYWAYDHTSSACYMWHGRPSQHTAGINLMVMSLPQRKWELGLQAFKSAAPTVDNVQESVKAGEAGLFLDSGGNRHSTIAFGCKAAHEVSKDGPLPHYTRRQLLERDSCTVDKYVAVPRSWVPRPEGALPDRVFTNYAGSDISQNAAAYWPQDTSSLRRVLEYRVTIPGFKAKSGEDDAAYQDWCPVWLLQTECSVDCISGCELAFKGQLQSTVRKYGSDVELGNYSDRFTNIMQGERKHPPKHDSAACAIADSIESVWNEGIVCGTSRIMHMRWDSLRSRMGLASEESADLELDNFGKLPLASWGPKVSIALLGTLFEFLPYIMRGIKWPLFQSQKFRTFVTVVILCVMISHYRLRFAGNEWVGSGLALAATMVNLITMMSTSDSAPSPLEFIFSLFGIMFQGTSLAAGSAWIMFASAGASAICLLIATMGATKAGLGARVTASLSVSGSLSYYNKRYGRSSNVIFGILYAPTDLEAVALFLGLFWFGTGVPPQMMSAHGMLSTIGFFCLALRYFCALSYITSQVGGGPFLLTDGGKLSLRIFTNIFKSCQPDDEVLPPAALVFFLRNPGLFAVTLIYVLSSDDRAGKVLSNALLHAYTAQVVNDADLSVKTSGGEGDTVEQTKKCFHSLSTSLRLHVQAAASSVDIPQIRQAVVSTIKRLLPTAPDATVDDLCVCHGATKSAVFIREITLKGVKQIGVLFSAVTEVDGGYIFPLHCLRGQQNEFPKPEPGEVILGVVDGVKLMFQLIPGRTPMPFTHDGMQESLGLAMCDPQGAYSSGAPNVSKDATVSLCCWTSTPTAVDDAVLHSQKGEANAITHKKGANCKPGNSGACALMRMANGVVVKGAHCGIGNSGDAVVGTLKNGTAPHFSLVQLDAASEQAKTLDAIVKQVAREGDSFLQNAFASPWTEWANQIAVDNGSTTGLSASGLMDVLFKLK